jgi:hypothetical protein
LAVLYPEDAFESMVPEVLRDWVQQRTHIRKVIVDKDRRLVMSTGPDSDTSSIMIDFGQTGPKMTYDYLKVLRVDDDGTVWNRLAPPGDDVTMQFWLKQSTNSAAGAYLREVMADIGVAFRLNCSFVTSCSVTAEMIDQISMPGLRTSANVASALSVELPMVDTISIEQLADLIQRETAAFEAFRTELRAVVESLASIPDESNRAAEARIASNRLAREQVHEVDRKLREAQRHLKYSIPITAAALLAGGLGAAATGGVLAVMAAVLSGAAVVGATAKDYQGHRSLPGYFLWKLKNA